MQRYLTAIREYLKDYFLENTGLKVLALLITAVIWLSVASRPVAQVALRNVPILFLNLSASPLLEVTDTDVPSAQVYLEGPRDIVDSIRPNEVTVIADMTGVGITKVGADYAVKVNLRSPLPKGVTLPADIDGVPVCVDIVGKISRRG